MPLPNAPQRDMLLRHLLQHIHYTITDMPALITLCDGMSGAQIQTWIQHVITTCEMSGVMHIGYAEFMRGMDGMRAMGQAPSLYRYPPTATASRVIPTVSIDTLSHPLTATQISTLAHTHLPYGLLTATPAHATTRDEMYGMFTQLFTAAQHRVQWSPHMPLVMGRYNRYGEELVSCHVMRCDDVMWCDVIMWMRCDAM